MNLSDYEYDWDDRPSPNDYRLHLSDADILDLIEEHDNMEWDERPKTKVEELLRAITSKFWDDEVHVVVYSVGQGYGGPEEGGWHFPVYGVEQTFMVEHTGHWATYIPLVREVLDLTRQYWASEEHGTYGSMGGWAAYHVALELYPQGAEVTGHETTTHRPSYC